MKKYWPGILILLLFLMLLSYTIYYASKTKDENSKSIFNVSKSNISVLQMNVDLSYEIRKINDNYKLLIPEEVPSLKAVVETLLENVSKIEYVNIIDQDAKDMEQFGFARPNASFNIILSDGISRAFEIGRQIPADDGYYFREKDKTTIYNISSTTASGLLTKLNDIIEKKILNIDKEKLSKVILNFEDSLYEIQNADGLWLYNGKELNKDKLNFLFDEIRKYTVDGIAKRDYYIAENIKPYIKLSFILNDDSVQSIAVIKRDEENYNLVKEGISAQYQLSKSAFDNYSDTISAILNEAVSR